MNKNLPDNWVKKAVYSAINDIEVNNVVIPCFANRADNDYNFYTLLTTQTTNQNTTSKCESHWISTILIDIVTIYNGTNNPGNSTFVSDITNAVIQATDNLTLDAESGLRIENQNVSTNNLGNETPTQNVFRKLVRIEMTIN